MSVDGARKGERGVLAVGVIVAAAAAGLYALALAGEQRLDAPLEVTAAWLAVAFFGCELFALRVERTHGESYGFTLALVPLAVGLVYASPEALVSARVVGAVAACRADAVAITTESKPGELQNLAAALAPTDVELLVAPAIADVAGAGTGEDGLHGPVHERIRDADLQAHLVVQLDLHRHAAIGLHLLHLPTVPAHAGDGEPPDFGAEERLQDVVQLLGPDDRYDQLHCQSPCEASEAARSIEMVPVEDAVAVLKTVPEDRYREAACLFG